MPYSYPEIKNFQGLFLQANSFVVPDGALEQAENVTISKDFIISKKRGEYLYYHPLAGTLNKLFTYQDKLLAAYANSIGYYTDTGSSPNETGLQTSLTGESVIITSPMVSRSLQSNNNFYFTTSNGVLKITAYNSIICKSGAPQGLDISAAYVNGSSAVWFNPGDIVGYRVLFGYRDANDNLILGAPSDITVISNPQISLANDSGVAVVAGGGPFTVTVTSVAHGLVTGQYLVFSSAQSGTSPTYTDQPNANGEYQITVTGADTFTYSISSNTSATPLTKLNYAYAMPVRLEFSIPSEITTSLPWFYQIYRSSQQAIAVGILSDFKLVAEEVITSAQISARVAFFTDTFDDFFLGAQLYTNENSREGELQANYRPPLCTDVALYKGYSVYSDCTTRQLISLSVIDTTVMANNDYVEFKIDATVRRYVARTGVGNTTVRGTCSSSAGLLITYANHGLVNNDTVYIANVVGGALLSGTYFVIAAATNTFKISLTSGGSAIAYGGETALDFEGVTNGTYPIFTLSTDSSAAVRLAVTAQGLVKAVNRDPLSLIYAEYTSLPNDVPGNMRFQAKGFGNAIYIRANSTAAGGAFSPVLPDSFVSGTQVYSRNDVLPNVIFVSKLNEPEAVPLVNFFTVGAKNKSIVRIHALRDSLIILKEDGVYRMTGDTISNFSITILDGTVHIVADSSADVINNQVIFLSNQGVCLVTESSVQIVSRKIEDVIQPLLGQPNLSSQTSGVSYESERLYLLTTTDPNDTTATHVYAYNILTEGWTSWDSLFKQAVIGPNDILYYISLANEIQKERKTQTKIDYTGQNYPVTISNVSTDKLSCTLTIVSGIPAIGDIVVKSNVINVIAANPVFVVGNDYNVIFDNASNLDDGDSEILYKGITSKIKMAPFHGGLVGRSKQFSQMQIHLRDNSVSRATISFIGDTFSGSESVDWRSQLIRLGWGFFPWGFEPWGQTNVINLTQGTQPAPIIRLYVPRFQARNTFIQAYIEHYIAGEPLNIQSLSYTVRAYNERVSK